MFCARSAGIDENILKRAQELHKLFQQNIPPEQIRYATIEQDRNTNLVQALIKDPSLLLK